MSLLERDDIDYIFLPSIVGMEKEEDGFSNNYLCPYVQTIPYLVNSALSVDPQKLLRPVVDFAKGRRILLKHLIQFGQQFDKTREEVERALEIAEQVACGLDAIHRLGIVHRDVKPGNILLTEGGQAKLSDLGVAKELRTDVTDVTSLGQTVGSPAYMSPEQSRPMATVDARSDVYSLGATLFHMLAGRKPYEGTREEILQKLARSPIPNIKRYRPRLNISW